VRASLLRCSVCPAKPDVVTLSSSSTEEALELLFLSPPRDPVSHFSEPSCSSGSDQLEDWPKVNDTTVSVYVALTADVSNSCTSTVNAPRDERKSCAELIYSTLSLTSDFITEASPSKSGGYWCPIEEVKEGED
jgi:hypothetical protein